MGRKKRVSAAPEELSLTDSFVKLVKRMGPKRPPSSSVRRSLLFQLGKKDTTRNLGGLIEWYMHVKRRTWEEDCDRGQRWKEFLEQWIDENRALISAVILAKK